MPNALPPVLDGDGASDHGLPARIGEYQLERVLAQGGFGVVSRAQHVVTGAWVAIKVVNAALTSNPTVVARFQREVEAIQRVRHPNVVEIFGHGSLDDGRSYIVMELIDGDSLREHLELRGRLPPDEVVALFEQLCGAVEAAHARAIVHRDIKPSNVVLDRDGRAVLLDFGVAKLLDDEGPSLTGSRHVVGSLSCMAPEQILVRPVDARTDVYALGVLAYRALTGEIPFKARSTMAIQQMHLTAVPRAPSSVAPVPHAFDAVLLRALAKEPAERQPTALSFLNDLRAAASGRDATNPAEQPVIVVFVEARVPPDALDVPSEALLSDLEEIFPRAAAELAKLGLSPAMETGTSLLLAVRRPDALEEDAALRGEVLRVVRELHERLVGDLQAKDAVHLQAYVHVGTLALDAVGTAIGGALLEIDAWLPADVDQLPAASRAALAGVQQPVRELSLDGAWSALERPASPVARRTGGDDTVNESRRG